MDCLSYISFCNDGRVFGERSNGKTRYLFVV